MERPLLRFCIFASYLGQQSILRTQSSVSHQDSCVASGKWIISSPNGQDGWMVKKVDFFFLMESSNATSSHLTPWTIAHQAPPSMGLSRQKYWSGLPFPSPVDLPNPGIKPGSSALQANSLLLEPPRKPSKLPTPPPPLAHPLCTWGVEVCPH